MNKTETQSAPTQAALSFAGRNPDVLTCIANLSNDEVFTPPELANQMLDVVESAWAESHDGASIWSDSTVTFLDPFTKSGVFLREITKRLVDGLADEINDLSDRVDHILTKQVYGIGITELTALLARRSLYCSKWADGEHSIAKSFDGPDGNIWFKRTEHTWANGKCRFCGATPASLDRGDDLESHAYAFIHTDEVATRIAELFGDEMQFDVIIGNPPYQINSDGNTRTRPIYNLFADAAIGLDPLYLVMVTPSRWFTGGLGLDEFRSRMIEDRRLRHIVDHPKLFDVFPAVEIKGGVSYFLWDRDHSGDCEFSVRIGGQTVSNATRDLREGGGVLIRSNEAAAIIKKVQAKKEPSIAHLISAQKPFGLLSNFSDFALEPEGDSVRLYRRGLAEAWVARNQIIMGQDLISPIKVLTPEAADGHGRIPATVTGTPFVVPGDSVCTQTFLVAGTWPSIEEAENFAEFLKTKFARFLIHQRKVSQHSTSDAYKFVPHLSTAMLWTDESLYARYGLTESEIDHIESTIRPLV